IGLLDSICPSGRTKVYLAGSTMSFCAALPTLLVGILKGNVTTNTAVPSTVAAIPAGRRRSPSAIIASADTSSVLAMYESSAAWTRLVAQRKSTATRSATPDCIRDRNIGHLRVV